MSAKSDSIDLNIDQGETKINKNVIRVGSRKSELALVQTNHVISLLQKLYPNQKFEIHKMTTVGDRVLNISLPKIGEKSLFTRDLEDALREGIVDFVVHSLKDLPTALPDGMTIGAVLTREDARDALVLAKQHAGKCLKTLPEGSIIGTSSLRRTAQISRLYPHLKVQDIRGNLNTRLAKLDAADSKYAGIVLAQAGLERLGWQERVTETIEPSEILYAVGQGALAVECLTSNMKILTMLENLVCHETQCRILVERSFLKTLGGGCSAPVAVHSSLVKRKHDDNTDSDARNVYELHVIGSVWSLDGKIEIQTSNACDLNLSAITDDDEVPAKRIKLSAELETVTDFNNDQPSPPKIVDHSQVDLNAASTLDIVGIMNAHNSAFKKCPYSSLVDTNAANESQSVESDGSHSLKCPLHVSVGQDVMGQCPYFNATFSKEVSSKKRDSCGGCPFKNGCSSDSNTEELSSGNTVSIEKCPFLASKGNSSKNDDIKSNAILDEKSTDKPLFCGLFPHHCWPLEVFEKCEQLGKDLALLLIDQGALAVMESAQNEIRQKI